MSQVFQNERLGKENDPMSRTRPARIWACPKIALLASTLLLIMPALVVADDDGPKAYAIGLVGGSWATLDTSGANFATPAPISGDGTDASVFGGGAIGGVFDLGAVDLRLELEGTGGRSFDFVTPGAAGPYFTRASLWTLQGNFWFEYPLSKLWPDAPIVRNIAPFGGGGLGVRQTSIETTNGAVAGRTQKTGLAWQGGGGLSYRLSDLLSVEARYQYADLGGAEIPLVNASGLRGTMDVDLGSHEVIGGVRFTFR
jgi:opacity protein-like surface antigen